MTNPITTEYKIQTPFDYTLSIIGGKWKMKLMYQLAIGKVTRYGELKRSIPGITFKVLTTQLKDLENSEIVLRKEYSEKPLKVEYSLTPKGRTLMPILEEMCKWGLNHASASVNVKAINIGDDEEKQPFD